MKLKLMKLILMNRSEERELFLKYIVDTYLKNPNLSISSDIIYHELSRFSTYNKEHCIIDGDSLVGVQVGLNNKFKNNTKANTFTSRDGYFWAIENRGGKKDKEFFSEMYNSIKLYVSVDPDYIYKVSELLFNFMLDEGIIMQSKISKGMRNDALVCRVSGEDAARKVSQYLNELNYETKFRPNPFLLDEGKVSVAMDGCLSYNRTLSNLLKEYFDLKKSSGQLDKINCDDFSKFVENQIDMLESKQKKYFMNLYGISNEEKCKSFLIVCNLITKNLDGTLTLDSLFKYGEINNVTFDNDKRTYSKQDEDKMLYVINSLTNYYSVGDVHKIIMMFIENNDIRLFTRKDDIRAIVNNNFTSDDVKKIVSNLGWNAFIDASKVTYEKYGEEQLFAAIKRFFYDEDIQSFTNDYEVRSRLGLVIPPKLLKSVIAEKLSSVGKNISSISLTQFILDEINKIDKNNGDEKKDSYAR